MATKTIQADLSAQIEIPNIGGFLFNIPNKEELTLQSDITDHFVENGAYLNDHIVKKPRVFTLNAIISEISFSPAIISPDSPDSDLTKIINKINDKAPQYRQLTNKLTKLNPLMPFIKPEIINKQNKLKAIANNALYTNLYKITPSLAMTAPVVKRLIKQFASPKEKFAPIDVEVSEYSTDLMGINLKANSLQELWYRFFELLWFYGTTFEVQTPWGMLSNCCIQSLKIGQDGETAGQSTFDITFKQLKFFDTKLVPFNAKNYETRAAMQAEPMSNQGKAQGLFFDIGNKSIFKATVDTLYGNRKKQQYFPTPKQVKKIQQNAEKYKNLPEMDA